MILLDTNVLSALMQDHPDAKLIDWLNNQTPAEIWTTAITVFEIRFGLSRLKPSKKRAKLEYMFETLIQDEFAARVAPVDSAAAESAATLAARREAAGRPVDIRDTLIAGIAISRRSSIATRNLRHFTDLDIPVLDPWTT